MLRQPLFRAGLVILAVSLALVFMPFYDRDEPFAFVNLVLFSAGFLCLTAGAVRH